MAARQEVRPSFSRIAASASARSSHGSAPEAVSIDRDCMTDQGFIEWDKVKPAHYCGMRYQDRFVPAYDKPTRGVWSYDGRDEEFRPGEDWRSAHRSTD